MNIMFPVSRLMSTDLVTVNPDTPLTEVRKLMDQHEIHHLPVVEFRRIVGLISKTDLLHFLHGFTQNPHEEVMEAVRLKRWTAKEIMTTKLGKVQPNDTIRTALDIFKINRFHALPVVEGEELVGILTTHDIIRALADSPIALSDYSDDK